MNPGSDTAEKGRGRQVLWRLGGAVCLAVACAVVASHSTGGLRAELGGRRALGAGSDVSLTELPPFKPTAKVLVARQEVPSFTKITEPEKFFEVKELAEVAFPKDALKNFGDVKDQCLKDNLKEGSPVSKSDLLPLIPPDFRATTVAIGQDGVPDELKPGSRVDVLATITHEGKTRSNIILENMLVLTEAEPFLPTDSTLPPLVRVTFAIRAEDSSRLVLACAIGKVRLILRSRE